MFGFGLFVFTCVERLGFDVFFWICCMLDLGLVLVAACFVLGFGLFEVLCLGRVGLCILFCIDVWCFRCLLLLWVLSCA